jgi:exopolysaccharide biosynthesis protein
MRKIFFFLFVTTFYNQMNAQLKWTCVDSLYQPLLASVHVYKTNDSLGGKPNIAYYVSAELKNKKLTFTADTTYKRRLTPTQFFEKNNKPLLVVNCTFFSFETNQNLNVVVKDGKMVGYNIHSIAGRGKDTLTYRHPFRSAIGISKKRDVDIAWIYTDSSSKFALASRWSLPVINDSFQNPGKKYFFYKTSVPQHMGFEKWKIQTAVGGGPVLLQNGEIKITNEEEMMFVGKRINEKEPRTAMGYTKDDKLIMLVVQGRYPGISEGATLIEEAQIFKDLGCWEALNLDGGGSSCLLINGKNTIQPSSNGVQRPVPAVFLVKEK